MILKDEGFTLTELLVSIGLLSIISGIVLTQSNYIFKMKSQNDSKITEIAINEEVNHIFSDPITCKDSLSGLLISNVPTEISLNTIRTQSKNDGSNEFTNNYRESKDKHIYTDTITPTNNTTTLSEQFTVGKNIKGIKIVGLKLQVIGYFNKALKIVKANLVYDVENSFKNNIIRRNTLPLLIETDESGVITNCVNSRVNETKLKDAFCMIGSHYWESYDKDTDLCKARFQPFWVLGTAGRVTCPPGHEPMDWSHSGCQSKPPDGYTDENYQDTDRTYQDGSTTEDGLRFYMGYFIWDPGPTCVCFYDTSITDLTNFHCKMRCIKQPPERVE